MNEEVQIELLKLASGDRLLRLQHPVSGLCLEKRLDPQLPIATQKSRWQKVFESLLTRELLPT